MDCDRFLSIRGDFDLESDPKNRIIKEENDALLGDILEQLDSENCKTPEVILLFGKSGAGKSAIVNTIHKALSGNYYLIAKPGKGEASQKTMELNRYENCGVKLATIANALRKERMNDTKRKLPHILDCAGLPNENTGKLKELLELLIGGFIPPRTKITHLQELQKKNGGEGSLKILYETPNPEWKVTKIAFVQGCVDAIPINLIECLNETLEIVDEVTCMPKYQVDLFVLITKYDLVRGSKDINLHATDQDEQFNVNDLEKVEDYLAQHFNYEGVSEFNKLRWVNLTQNVGLDNPFVDNIALQFIKQMIVPGVPIVKDFKPVMDWKKRARLHIHRLRNKDSRCLQQTQLLFLIAAMVAILAVVLILLKETAKEGNNVSSSIARIFTMIVNFTNVTPR